MELPPCLKSPEKNTNTVPLGTASVTTVQLDNQEVIQAAESSLTTEKKEKIQRRQDAVDAYAHNKPTRGKGKTIDPREWGNIDLNEDEMNPETQNTIHFMKGIIFRCAELL